MKKGLEHLMRDALTESFANRLARSPAVRARFEQGIQQVQTPKDALTTSAVFQSLDDDLPTRSAPTIESVENAYFTGKKTPNEQLRGEIERKLSVEGKKHQT